jgi:hypothetical protein
MDLLECLHDELVSGKLVAPSQSTEIEWFPLGIHPPYATRDTSGGLVPITELSLTAKFGVRYHFGHIADIPGLSAIHATDTNSTTFLFRESDLPNIVSSCKEFRSQEDIPTTYALTINLIRRPEKANRC